MASLHTLAITPVLFGLKNTAGFLQKALNHAKEHSIDPATFLSSRIHPTMLDLTFQINTLAEVAKVIPNRINSSIEPLDLPRVEKTIPEFITRIKKIIDYLEAVKPEDVNGREQAEVKFLTGPPGNQKSNEFSGLGFVQCFAHPYFWFHVTTAYNILRKEGVDVGKADFLGTTQTKVEW
ncbi:hypothetical protein EJ02DRAFT_431713 [Clathrospora elynae]|uniref:Uncharacterized protein n=1 Tax=Clathrospora elynae TaxID=706981 RepID=A0A6A5SZF0_9PLEO|nr:hypothetical protein EJ02DRAFT_431713 [Clathrospora elynae]